VLAVDEGVEVEDARAYVDELAVAQVLVPALGVMVTGPEPIDGMIAQVMRQTDQTKINALMRNIFTRLRSEHYGVPVVSIHAAYATAKTLGKWNPGAVMYDLFIDQLASGK
jgi:DNA-binding transcriptional regulator YbjK